MRRDDIINAAIEEFGRYDYDRASINSIIENSNTSKGTFYYYFNNKEALYLELVKKVSQEKTKFLQESIKESKNLTDDSSIFEILENQIEISMKFALTYPKYAKYSAKVANETNVEIKEKVQSMIGNTTNEFLKQLIKKNITQHKIRNDFPEEFICHLFVYMITHFNDFILNMGVNIDPSHTSQIMEYLNYFIDFLENGLRHKKS